jgi:hypothetical protein
MRTDGEEPSGLWAESHYETVREASGFCTATYFNLAAAAAKAKQMAALAN